MPKYRVDTENGSYIVETGDPVDSQALPTATGEQPVRDYGSIGAASPGQLQRDIAYDKKRAESESPMGQLKEYGANLVSDAAIAANPLGGLDRLRSVLNIADRLSRPILNPIRRFFDPTNALGGSVLNLERNRPMANDPEAAFMTDLIAENAVVPAAAEIAGLRIPAKAQEALMIEKGPGLMPSPAKIGYRESQRFIRNLPSTRLSLADEIANSRSGLQAERTKKVTNLLSSNQAELQAELQPVQQEISNLQQGRRTAQQNLARTSAEQTVQNRQNIQSLRNERTAAEEAEKARVAGEAEGFVGQHRSLQSDMEAANVPRVPEKTQFQSDVTAARQKNYSEIQSTIRKTHKDIVAIGERPENAAVKITEKPSKVLDASGKPIVKTTETKVPGQISTDKLKAAEAKNYENMQDEIQVAVNNGSPAARALKQLYEHEGTYSLEQALDIRAALNKIGYHDADAAMTDASQAIARRLSAELSKEIRTQVKGFKSGGEEAIKLLDREAELLSNREAVFGTKAARESRRTMERYGDATRLKDPVALESWMYQVDEPTRAAAKAQVADDLLKDGPQKFASKWKSMDPEVKELWFGKDGVKRGDEIANASDEGLKKIAQRFKDAESSRINKAVEASADIRKKRAELSNVQAKIDDLRKKAEGLKGIYRERAEFQRKLIEADYRSKKDSLRRTISHKKLELNQKQQAAQDKIDRIQKVQRIGWIALAAGVGSQASRIYHGAHNYLTGEP